MLLLWLLLFAQSAQSPSPMSDSTRPHPRIARYEVPGQRIQLTIGTLYVSPDFRPEKRHPLVVHFHGAPWLLEHHVRRHAPQAGLITVQLGAGSRGYADAFAEPDRLARLVEEASARAGELVKRPVTWDSIALTSFSAGYGAVRSILQHPAQYDRIDAVALADSLHASYTGDATRSRGTDLPVDILLLHPFMRFAVDAAAGRKRMLITHSEVFPGTYPSTTETADVLLRHVNVRRRAVLRQGPVGMQQLSEAMQGQLRVSGFAGNSAPDHMDHLYAIGETLLAPMMRGRRR
ncbi:MAG TPA: hypothetical protein VNJ03_13215 [Vicinamibacterales bacterium]|nr:hypothetical protein [Vicinamibacterales bacterium]